MRDLKETYRNHLNPNYVGKAEWMGTDATIVEASGATLRDDRGNRFLDFTAGYGIFNLGHNPKAVIDAVQRTLGRAALSSRPFLDPALADVASDLAEIAPWPTTGVFLCSSGAEAVDSALKLARLTTGRLEFVTAEGAFHGFTVGALSVSGIPEQVRPFGQLLPDVRHIPYGDATALSEAVTTQTAALILEPIQAEVGAIAPPPGYIAAAQRICQEAGALLVVDEVRTGMGRTGPLLSIDEEDVVPDVLLLGKALGSGVVPVGAMVARADLWSRFGLSFAMSASSFSGNRLATSAVKATLDEYRTGSALKNGAEVSDRFWGSLGGVARSRPDLIRKVTGRGLLIGLHFRKRSVADAVVRSAIRQGVLVATAFCDRRCILLEPPLVLTLDEADTGLATLIAAIDEQPV